MKNLLDLFESTSGTVIGTYHIKTNKNNHDSLFYVENKDHIVAIVCDGCGSGSHSEVGSSIGVTSLAWELTRSGIHRAGNDAQKVAKLLESIRHLMINRISSCAYRVGLPFVKVISEYFLFTIVAVVIGKENTYVFSLGDGTYNLNGTTTVIGPFENNAPPYIAYGAIVDRLNGITENDLRFVVNEIIPTEELQSIVICTDGIDDFIAAENKKIPGKDELVGPLSQFWTNDLFFKNHTTLERRLCLINRTFTKINRKTKAIQVERGHLLDDTTLIAIRRRQDDSIFKQEETKSESV